MLNLDLIKTIDFRNPENILFFAIIFVIVLLVLITIIFVIYKISKAIRNFFVRFKSNQAEKRIASVDKGEDLNVVVKELIKSKTERAIAQGQKIVTATTSGPIKGAKEDVVKKNDKESFKESEQKKIEEGLNRIKAGEPGEEDTLEAKMPSRSNQEEDKFKEIKIPVSKRVEVITDTPKHVLEASHLPEKNHIGAPNNVSGPKAVLGEENNRSIPGGLFKKEQVTDQGKPFEKPDFMKNTLIQKIKRGANAAISRGIAGGGDESVFRGRSEVSRSELEQDMESSAGVWKAAIQSGLTMTPIERSKLVKDVFSSAYGRNISKNDLKSGIAKLGRKMLDTTNTKEHAKIRKEIKFLKKIGGIKG